MSEVGEPIEVCPECDQAGITQRHRSSGPQYRCPRCTHKFDTPRVRERRGNSSGGSGGTMPAKLAGMTPEEFDELRTDGGEDSSRGTSRALLADDRQGAVISDDGQYRYRLSRTWNTQLPTVAFVMLNPSTADDVSDDNTIRRCIGFAKDWGYGRLVVVNLFALRTKDPSVLRRHPTPVGPENDEHLQGVCEDAERVIVAWGTIGSRFGREAEVARLLDDRDLYALDETKDGHPAHPLYQPADADPTLWEVS